VDAGRVRDGFVDIEGLEVVPAPLPEFFDRLW
jgi:hypothetical protein